MEISYDTVRKNYKRKSDFLLIQKSKREKKRKIQELDSLFLLLIGKLNQKTECWNLCMRRKLWDFDSSPLLQLATYIYMTKEAKYWLENDGGESMLINRTLTSIKGI